METTVKSSAYIIRNEAKVIRDRDELFVEHRIGSNESLTRYGPVPDAQTANALAFELVAGAKKAADRTLAELAGAMRKPAPSW